MPPSRRGWSPRPGQWLRLLAPLLVAGFPGISPLAAPAPCPSLEGQTLRWIVPNSAGGGYDTYSRLLQPFLEKDLRATIVVENRSDAGGLVAAAAIRDAVPDGRTIGIINAAGLLAARLDGSRLDPASDFTILARILSNRIVLLTGRESGIKSLDELLRVSTRRPIVIGVRDAGSASIVAVPVIADLLSMDYALVTGYVGNTARILALVRGEIDLLVQNLDSTRPFIADGTLRPLLQVTGTLADRDPLLAGVPVLGGEAGIAQSRAALAGKSRAQALTRADSLAALVDAGRLVVAPRALPDNLRRCLETAVANVLRGPELQAAAARAKLRIEPASAADARADVAAAAAAMAEFAPLVKATMQRARQ